MKKLIAMLLATTLVSSCTTMAGVEVAVQKSAPAACKAVSAAYQAYLASGHGSIRDKQIISEAYATTTGICADPSRVTAGQLAIVAYQLAMIAKTLKRVKSNG